MGCYFSILLKIPKTSRLNFKSDLTSKWQFGEWSQLVPFRSKPPSDSPGWTNFLKILLSLVALWKGQSILWVRNIQPSPKAAAFCSERSDIVHNLIQTGNCLNQETGRNDKMAVALLPPLPVLVSSSPGWQLFLREGQDVSHMSSAAWVEALSGMIYFHHTFHLPKRQLGAGSPSTSTLVLYLSSSPSLNVSPSSWGSTVLFVLLRRVRPNSSSQISSRFSRTLPVEDDVIGTFLLLQWTLSLLCVNPKALRSQC